MAYGFNNYGSPYFGQNYIQMPTQQAYQRPMVQSEIMRVNGEAGAKSVRLRPNGGVLRLDETSPILWLIQADGAGYTTATPFTISRYQQAPQIDLNSLENRVKKLEDILNEQPDIENVKRKTKQADNE